MEERIGLVVRVSIYDGLAALLEEGEEANVYPFTFDKIEDFVGQNPRELKRFSSKGLREGVMVKFILDDNSRIMAVKPLVFKTSGSQ